MRSVVKYPTFGMRILGLDASFTQLQQLPNMAIQVMEFSSGGTKLERFLHKNQPKNY